MKILLIDDDEINNFISGKIIRKIQPDAEIQSCLNGKSGLDIFNEFKPDIVLLDTNMPIMDGWEFLDNVKINHPCKIFITSSSIFANDSNRARTYPIVCDFVCKPLTIDKFNDVIFKQ